MGIPVFKEDCSSLGFGVLVVDVESGDQLYLFFITKVFLGGRAAANPYNTNINRFSTQGCKERKVSQGETM